MPKNPKGINFEAQKPAPGTKNFLFSERERSLRENGLFGA
jgi:hypothetical protein